MAKRGNSEGSIYKRADGRWVGQLTVAGGGRKYLYADTRREAAELLAGAMADRDRGLPSLDGNTTVGQYLQRWLEEVARPRVRLSTYEGYKAHIRVHLEPALGRVKLAQLQPTDVQRLLNRLSSEGREPSTVHRVRATLRNALNNALRWGLVQRNVAALVTPPRMKQHEIAPYSVDEAKAVLAAVQQDYLGPLYGVALSTGMREGELLGLTWPDVDFGAGTITIQRTLVRVKGKMYLPSPKSLRSRRTLPLPRVVVTMLARQRDLQTASRLLAGRQWKPMPLSTGDQGDGPEVTPDLVFTNRTGGPLHSTYVLRHFKDLLTAAGLPVRTFHALRHSCATFLIAQGVDLRTVMEQLGHSQISLTANTYAHVLPSVLRDAADRMDALLEPEGESPSAAGLADG